MAALDTVVSALTSFWTMLGGAYDFVISKPLLLAIVLVPLGGLLLGFITSLFRK